MLEVPSQEVVVKDLSTAFPIIHASLDYGTHKVRDFFDAEERSINRYLAPNLVRYYALDYLSNHGLERIVLGNVPNNGLYLSNDQYNIKILKSNHERIPVPGHSLSRQRYYQQQQQFFFLTDVEDSEKLNLLLLWDVIGRYQLGKLALACPQSGGLTRESVSAHWHCLIPQEYYFKQSSNIDVKDVVIEDLPLQFNIDEGSVFESKE